VSPRTFFNYFASRDDAVIGADATVTRRLADELLARPADEPPLAALRAVLLGADEELADTPRRLAMRSELLRRHPALLPRFLAGLVEIERALADALGRRLDLDPDDDPYPEVAVSATVATLRAALAWWDRTGRTEPLEDVAASALDALAAGFDRPASRRRP
jgi:AcrR family transcriptional regulator